MAQLKSNRKEYGLLLAYEGGQQTRDANFKVYTGLKKDDYYNLLADSRVVPCALQDWVSNTVSEADTFGTLTLYPAYRSFPEVFANNGNHLYVPWSIDDAVQKLQKMFKSIDNDDISAYNVGKISDYQDKTIDRTIDVLEGRRAMVKQWDSEACCKGKI